MNAEIVKTIKEKSNDERDYAVQLRRQFHKHPELGFQEFETSRTVKEALTSFGIPWKEMAGTGVVGLIDSGKPGKCVMLRADMDALPLTEKSGVEYSSEIPGVMHACGHDMHVAGLIAAAKILNELKENFSGSVKLMFQPSEEDVPGAPVMISEGILENPHVDYAVAHHIMGALPKGVIGIRYGGIMAAPDLFDFTIRGIGGHGSTPWLCTDVIAICCQAVTNMYASLARRLPAFDPASMSICSINGGNNNNVLPGEVKAKGTVRPLSDKTRKLIPEIIESSLKAACEGSGATYEFNWSGDIPALINDDFVTEKVEKAARQLLGDDGVIVMKEGSLGGEDFSFVSEKVPTCYYKVGLADDMDNCPVHHSETFAFDDSVLEVCISSMVSAAIELLTA